MDSPRPDLSDMALFVEVARLRSFSRAAESLGMPASSLSRRISQLEKSTGVTLLHRTSRRVETTEPGQAFYERALRIVADAQSAHDELVSAGGAPRGRVRMSVPVDFGMLFIAPVLVDFARAYPDVTFEIDMSPRRVDLLFERFDLAIRVGPLADSSLVARRLATVGVGLYASPSYLHAAGAPRTPAELARHQAMRVLLPEPAPAWDLVSDAGERTSVQPRTRFAVNNIAMLRELTAAGMGIGAFDAIVAEADLRAARIVRVLPGWSMPGLPIHALTPDTRVARRVRLWVDFLADRLRGYDGARPGSAQ